MADAATISRIGGLLKNTYGPQYVVEQQNKAAVTRKDFAAAPESARMGGDHYEFPVKVAGNRAAVQFQASDDALATPGRQNSQKMQIFDRMLTCNIKVFEKDIENSTGNDRAFINTLDDEVNGSIEDTMKVTNVDTFMDGTGIRATIATGVASATQTLAVGTAFGQFGSRYLFKGDVVDIYDSTLTTSRTGGVGLTIANAPTRSVNGGVATVVFGASVTTTTGDIVIFGIKSVNKAYMGLWGATNNDTGTFQGQSRNTFPIIKGTVIDAAGNGLLESHLQQVLTGVEQATGDPKMVKEFRTGNAQWDAYAALGYGQKRFTGTDLDKGFQSLDFNGIPFKKDTDGPPPAIFALNMEQVQNGIPKPLHWMDREGNMLKWNAGFAAWVAVLVEFGNYCYPRPNALARIQALSVANAYQQ
jgi:hypothetical protein